MVIKGPKKLDVTIEEKSNWLLIILVEFNVYKKSEYIYIYIYLSNFAQSSHDTVGMFGDRGRHEHDTNGAGERER